MQRKVAIYARVSTEHEAQLSALDNQVQYYDDLLAKHPDWILYKRYIDEGITGTSVKKRKNFMRMIEDAKSGYFDLIITREVSRFARNTVDTLQETRKLKQLGVEVYFIEDNIWTLNDEDGELKLTIMATLAQNESKKISQRVKAGQKISFENGVLYGTGNVLGYDKVGKEMIVNKEQAKTVKFIFESFLKGLGTTAIKCELEKNHILTATGLTKWNTATITRILQNPFYCGTIVYRKSYVPDFLEQKPCKNNGNVEQVIVEGTHEKIISKEDFEKVQAILKQHSQHLKNGRKIGRTVFQNVWSKKLVCKCGSKYNRRVYHKNDDITTYCYQCYNQKNNGSTSQRIKRGLDVTDSCNIPSVPEWKLSLIANSIFELLCKDKERLLSLANELLEQNVEDKVVESNDEIAELNAKLLNSNKKLEKLLDLYLNEMMTKDAYVNKKQEVEETIRLLKQKLDKLTADEVNAPATLADKVKDLKRLLCYKISDENSCISDSLIEGLIEKVIVDEDKFTVKIVSSSMVSTETTLLAKIVITKDDVTEYSRKHSQYKKLRIKNPILVELVI